MILRPIKKGEKKTTRFMGEPEYITKRYLLYSSRLMAKLGRKLTAFEEEEINEVILSYYTFPKR